MSTQQSTEFEQLTMNISTDIITIRGMQVLISNLIKIKEECSEKMDSIKHTMRLKVKAEKSSSGKLLYRNNASINAEMSRRLSKHSTYSKTLKKLRFISSEIDKCNSDLEFLRDRRNIGLINMYKASDSNPLHIDILYQFDINLEEINNNIKEGLSKC